MQAGEQSPAPIGEIEMKSIRNHVLATAAALIAACAMTTAPVAFAGTAMAGKAPQLKPQPGRVQVTQLP